MLRIAIASLRCLCRSMTGLAVLTVVTIGPVYAEEASLACRLLQVAELEAALGGKASKTPSGSAQSIPGMMALDQCSVVIVAPGKTGHHPVRISVVTNLPMDGAEAIRNRNTGTAREPQWKVSGARLEQATVGGVMCILAGRPDVASHTTCSIPRGKGYVEVDVISSVESMASIETVRALVQKASTRL